MLLAVSSTNALTAYAQVRQLVIIFHSSSSKYCHQIEVGWLFRYVLGLAYFKHRDLHTKTWIQNGPSGNSLYGPG
jgi:hypothetical protein